MANIYFIRHAQASFGKANYDSLSELGEKQSAMLGLYFKHNLVQPTVVYTGTLHRQQQTAEITLDQIFGESKFRPELNVTPELDEFTPIFWESAARNLAEINHTFQRTLEKLIAARSDNDKMSKGLFYAATMSILKSWQANVLSDKSIEPYQEFRNRIIGFYKKTCSQIQANETILAVSSGTPISILLARLQPQRAMHDFGWLSRIYNTSWQSIAVDVSQQFKKPGLTSINNVTHIKESSEITLI